MKSKRWIVWVAAVAAVIIFAGLGLLFASLRIYGFVGTTTQFTESSKALNNPDRGFYEIKAYIIRDYTMDFSEDPSETEQEAEAVPEEVLEEEDTIHLLSEPVLEMIQINLRKFESGALTECALENIDHLLENLSRENTRFVLRFLYDWSGRAEFFEPDDLEMICAHMEQLSPIFEKYEDRIFLVQGLFTGNWGEMNGSKFSDTESLRRLSDCLYRSAGEKIYLSVRTPAQWRNTTGLTEPNDLPEMSMASRIGLYNDGMMGNEGDCGTYTGSEDAKIQTPFSNWNREDELAFQNVLCRYVPNGGEVILDNPLNDFSSAVENLKTMHVTYLNSGYDTAVLKKWEQTVVTEDSCFQGMDGLNYIDRHLGYRYLLSSTNMEYSYLQNRIRVTAAVKNVGFAPIYQDKKLIITLQNQEQTISLEATGDLRELPGGNDQEQVLGIYADFPVSELSGTEYNVYFRVCDATTDEPLELANEQEPGDLGYALGSICFRHVSWFAEMMRLISDCV